MVKRAGIKRIVLATAYLSEVFIPYFGDGSKWGMEILYAVETEPLGTGGAIRNAAKYLSGDSEVVILNGDVLSSHDLSAQIKMHIQNKADVTLHLTKVSDARAYGCVPTSEAGQVTGFLEKMDNPVTNNINAGCYIFNKEIINQIPENQVVSVERETFPDLISANRSIFGFISDDYWLDIGTPSALIKGSRDLVTGKAAADALDRYQFAERNNQYLSMSKGITGTFTGGSAIGGFCKLDSCTIEGSIISDGVEAQDCIIRNSFVEIGAKLLPGTTVEGAFVDIDGEISKIL